MATGRIRYRPWDAFVDSDDDDDDTISYYDDIDYDENDEDEDEEEEYSDHEQETPGELDKKSPASVGSSPTSSGVWTKFPLAHRRGNDPRDTDQDLGSDTDEETFVFRPIAAPRLKGTSLTPPKTPLDPAEDSVGADSIQINLAHLTQTSLSVHRRCNDRIAQLSYLDRRVPIGDRLEKTREHHETLTEAVNNLEQGGSSGHVKQKSDTKCHTCGAKGNRCPKCQRIHEKRRNRPVLLESDLFSRPPIPSSCRQNNPSARVATGSKVENPPKESSAKGKGKPVGRDGGGEKKPTKRDTFDYDAYFGAALRRMRSVSSYEENSEGRYERLTKRAANRADSCEDEIDVDEGYRSEGSSSLKWGRQKSRAEEHRHHVSDMKQGQLNYGVDWNCLETLKAMEDQYRKDRGNMTEAQLARSRAELYEDRVQELHKLRIRRAMFYQEFQSHMEAQQLYRLKTP